MEMEEYATVMSNLECLKEVRTRTILLEQVKSSLKKSFYNAEGKEKELLQYRHEMELLLQEKMEHVEKLRLIHADINDMETAIKKTEVEYHNMHLESTKRYCNDYKPHKEVVDSLRNQIGLARLPELHEEDENFKPEFFEKQTTEIPEPCSLYSPYNQMQQQAGISSKPLQDRSQPGNSFPPMKSCLSCHQQIHRNAPICPLCKAKSRSRNPKKPKRKHND